MKYPCDLIRDLLPLYQDGVCNEESRAAVEEHLRECPSCRAYQTALCEADGLFPVSGEEPEQTADQEFRKAASLRAVRKTLLQRQVLAAVLALAVLAVLVLSAIGFLRSAEQVIPYEDNISVSMVDGNLMGRLQGNEATHLTIKRVESEEGETYLFFCLSGNRWDDLVTSDEVYSEYMLCAAEKDAAGIDGVYYYTGDYTGIETLESGELEQLIGSSTLLWNP